MKMSLSVVSALAVGYLHQRQWGWYNVCNETEPSQNSSGQNIPSPQSPVSLIHNQLFNQETNQRNQGEKSKSRVKNQINPNAISVIEEKSVQFKRTQRAELAC